MYRCAVLQIKDSLSLLLRQETTISSTSRQFRRLLEVIIDWTTELEIPVTRRGWWGVGEATNVRELLGLESLGFSKRLLLLRRPSASPTVPVEFSKRLLLLVLLVVVDDVVLASSMAEK
jgi:hypothetical protein